MSSKKVKEIFDKKIFRGEIKFDQPMSGYTSLKIGGPVEAMVFPEDVVSLKNVLIETKKESIPIFVLGAGTNLLVRDSGIDGIAVCLKAFKRIEVIQNINGIAGRFFSKEVLGTSAGFFVEAGAPLSSLINFAKKKWVFRN
ncbi:MAG: FAD-binding protein [Nitrospirae bacterium]|nr:FAD-binding protein [Nitrospirota bacterium]